MSLLKLFDDLLIHIAKDTTLESDDLRNLCMVNRRMQRIVDSAQPRGVKFNDINSVASIGWANFDQKVQRVTERWGTSATSLTWACSSQWLTRWFMGNYIHEYRNLKHLCIHSGGYFWNMPLLTPPCPLRGQGIGCTATLTSLRFVNLNDVEVTPDVGQLQALEELRYISCFRFQWIPAGLRNLRKLELLSCETLTSLGPLTDCTALKELRVHYCPITSLQPLSSCVRLTTLNLRAMADITSVDVLATCTALQNLSLCRLIGVHNYAVVQQLTRHLRHLTLHEARFSVLGVASSLESLYCSPVLEPLAADLPADLSMFTGLRGLWLRGSSDNASSSVTVPRLPDRLEVLRVELAHDVHALGNITTCTLLCYLDLRYTFTPFHLSFLPLITALRTLVLKSCTWLTSLKPLGRCETLQELNICDCSDLTSIYPLRLCRQLQKLDAAGCLMLTSLTTCSSLTQLSLAGCYVRSLQRLSECLQLRTLVLFECPMVTSLEPLLPLANVLEWLNVERMRYHPDIPLQLQACTTRGMRPWAQDGPVRMGDEDTTEGQLAWEDPFVCRGYARYDVS